MSNISPQQVILTLPDPRSVGSNPNEIDIPIITTGVINITGITSTPAISDVLVRDPVTGLISVNNTFTVGGVTSVGPVGAVPNANGASIVAPTLTLQPADATNPGVLTAGAQTIGGIKTFSDGVATSADVTLPATTATTGRVFIGANRALHTFGTNNVFVGTAGNFTLTGNSNVCVGNLSGDSITSASTNTFIGHNTGSNYTTGGNNICIGNTSGSGGAVGNTGNLYINNVGANESNSIRIGSAQTATRIAGITGYATPVSSRMVSIDADARLGSTLFITRQALTSNNMVPSNGGNIFTNPPPGAIQTITTGTLNSGAWAAPWNYPVTYSRIGSIIIVHFTNFTVTASSADMDYVYLGSSPFNPSQQQAQSCGGVLDSGAIEDTAYFFTILTNGEMYLCASNGQNLTDTWGLYADVNFMYVL
jgi:hypothetical protein